jgi:hypothetical protein
MKTLVIHPKDKSTYFLSYIYKDKDFTVLTDNIGNSKKRKLLKEYDRIIMLGHGSKYGLFGHKKIIISSNDVATLREKSIIAIWCNADEFVKKYNLKGFYTGMFISEVDEAYNEGIINVDFREIEKSNSDFAKILGKYLDDEDILEKVKAHYSDNNLIVNFNRDRLFFNDYPTSPP